MDIRLVDERTAVAPALAAVDADVVGVDVERSDGERYFRSAALVQVGVHGCCVILDAEALADLPELGHFLADRLAVLHAIENDVDPLDAAGVTLGPVADTAVAASLLGLPTGLGPLLADVVGIAITSEKERFQRADWSVRPLPEDMVAYAAGDVVHLPALWRELARRLAERDRTAWYEQELDATLDAVRSDRRSWQRTKGAGRLDGHGRAVLRELWEAREAIGRSEDVAPQRVARDDALVAMAEEPPGSTGVLARYGLRRNQVRAYGPRLVAAARRGAAAPDVPSDARRTTDEDRAAYDRMRRARAEVASEIGLDAGVLCPSRVLWSAVLADPSTPEELTAAAGLRPWQHELLAEPLWSAYAGS